MIANRALVSHNHHPSLVLVLGGDRVVKIRGEPTVLNQHGLACDVPLIVDVDSTARMVEGAIVDDANIRSGDEFSVFFGEGCLSELHRNGVSCAIR